MSVKAVAWALEQQTGNPALKSLLVVIANFSDDEGFSWPSRRTLARLTEISEKSVTRYTTRLQEIGLLDVEVRTLENGARSTNAFRLPMGARQLTLEGDTPRDNLSRAPGTHRVPAPGTHRVPAPGTTGSPGPRDTAVPTIEPSREPSRKQEQGALVSELPDWLPKDTWAAWEADRKERRKAYTTRGRELALKKLAALREGGHDPKAVIEQSIANGWTGLFPIDKKARDESKASADWASTEDGINRKGEELGIARRERETASSYRDRIRQRLEPRA